MESEEDLEPEEDYADNYVHLEDCSCIMMTSESEAVTSALKELITCPICRVMAN